MERPLPSSGVQVSHARRQVHEPDIVASPDRISVAAFRRRLAGKGDQIREFIWLTLGMPANQRQTRPGRAASILPSMAIIDVLGLRRCRPCRDSSRPASSRGTMSDMTCSACCFSSTERVLPSLLAPSRRWRLPILVRVKLKMTAEGSAALPGPIRAIGVGGQRHVGGRQEFGRLVAGRAGRGDKGQGIVLGGGRRGEEGALEDHAASRRHSPRTR